MTEKEKHEILFQSLKQLKEQESTKYDYYMVKNDTFAYGCIHNKITNEILDVSYNGIFFGYHISVVYKPNKKIGSSTGLKGLDVNNKEEERVSELTIELIDECMDMARRVPYGIRYKNIEKYLNIVRKDNYIKL